MTERILVIGATGRTGCETLRQLCRAGINARATVHTAEKTHLVQPYTSDIMPIEFYRKESIRAAMADVTMIYLALPRTQDESEVAKHVIDYAKKIEIQHIVYLSTVPSDDKTEFNFSEQKRKVEQHLESSGIRHTILQVTFFMQNFLKLPSDVTPEGENILNLFAGDGRAPMLDIRDIAAVAVKAFTGKARVDHTYRLTGPEALTFYQAAKILSEVLGKKIIYQPASEAEERETKIRSGFSNWALESHIELYNGIRHHQFEKIYHDFEKIMGRKPHTFAQFVNDYADRFRYV